MGVIDASDREEIIEVAEAMATAARSAILPYFRSDRLDTRNKDADGFDPVTVADRAAEEAMRAILAERRPQDAIVGEEFGTRPGTSGLTWVLDPIDGTRAFISGTPTWGVLIAVGGDAGPELGIIDQPYIGERFVGAWDRAWVAGPLGRHEARVSATRDLARATLFTTFPEVGTLAEGAAFRRVADHVQLVRYGMDCYAYGLLAAGQIDLVIEAGLASYDIQGPLAVIQSAGGIVTDWQGGPAHMGGQVIAAATPELHRAALDLLST